VADTTWGAVIGGDYVTADDLTGLATEAYVDSAVAAIDLGGYATESWVTGLGYGLATDIATNAAGVVQNASDIAAIDTSGIDTNTADIAQNASDIAANVASIASLEASGVDLTGYATEDWVNTQGYGLASDVAQNAADVAANAAGVAQNATDIGNIDLSGLATESYVDDAVDAAGGVAGLSEYLWVDTDSDAVVFEGANVFVQSGSGATDGVVNGLGNLVVGYNEGASSRTGSHNLVVGAEHEWTSYGGLVAGYLNAISGPYASVSGGYANAASGDYAAVSGGFGNTASGVQAVVSGGSNNNASWVGASISGGYGNTASGDHASVSGGEGHQASGDWSSITGGYYNLATNNHAAVSGGAANEANGWSSSVSGGEYNVVEGYWGAIASGRNNIASADYTQARGPRPRGGDRLHGWLRCDRHHPRASRRGHRPDP